VFARRNSVTLAAIWLLLLVIGIFWYTKDTREHVTRIEELQQARQTLKESRQQIQRLTKVETDHEETNQKWQTAPKRILSAEEPAFTLSYINWIISSNNLSNIYYDFKLNEKKQVNNHTEFIYTLNGEGTYNDIFRMIWYITYEPILYKIQSLSLRNKSDNSEYIAFTMKLQGFTVASSSEEEIDDTMYYRPADSRAVVANMDVFRPLISQRPIMTVKKNADVKPTLPPKLPGQIDVEKASLKAVTNNSIFISEGGGSVIELNIGDSVYLGRLVRIDQTTNQAEFIITKFGKSQRKVLRINERN
jgi:hypothetical protein